jgi:hypothetical protein
VGDGKEAGHSQGEEAMGRVTRRRVLAGLCVAASGLGFGCGGANPFLLIPTIFSGGQSKMPAEYPLTPQSKKENAKVVVLVSNKVGVHPDLVNIDRMLNAELIQLLDARVKENEEKVLILKMPRIDEYKSQNVNWRSESPYEIGKAVAEGVDYVINLEIVEIELFKPGPRRDWLKGHAVISVMAYDLSKPLKEPAYKKDITFEYPAGREIPLESDGQLSQFRMAFVQRIASDVSMLFVASSPVRRVD